MNESTNIELLDAINNLLTDVDEEGFSYLARMAITRDAILEDGTIDGETYKHMLDMTTMEEYVRGILSYLDNVLKDVGEILVVEDVMLLHLIIKFMKLVDYPRELYNLYFVSSSDALIANAKNALKSNMKDEVNTGKIYLRKSDEVSLEGLFPMKKFDMIVGNPPYAYIGKNGKAIPGRQFWHDFSEWSFNHVKFGAIVSMITPRNWLNSDQYSNLIIRTKYNLVKTGVVDFKDANVDAGYWVSIKEKYSGETNFDGIGCDVRSLPYFPLNSEFIPVFQKIFDKADRKIELSCGVDQRSNGHNNNYVNEKDDDHQYPVYHSAGKKPNIKYWGEAPKNQFDKKVLIGKNAAWLARYDDGEMGCNQHTFYCEVSNDKEGNQITNYLNTNLIKFVVQSTCRRQDASTTVLRNLPGVPMDRDWDDMAVYEYFGLDRDDIDMIEEELNIKEKE